MKVTRKILSKAEAIQLDGTKSSIDAIVQLQKSSLNAPLKLVWESLYLGSKRVQNGYWAVKENEYISVYGNSAFETLFSIQEVSPPIRWVKIADEKPPKSDTHYHWRGKRCGGYSLYNEHSNDNATYGFMLGDVPYNHIGIENLEWLDEGNL